MEQRHVGVAARGAGDQLVEVDGPVIVAVAVQPPAVLPLDKLYDALLDPHRVENFFDKLLLYR